MQNTNDENNLTECNVEALEQNPEGGGKKCYNTITTKDGYYIRYCGTCRITPGTATMFSGSDKC